MEKERRETKREMKKALKMVLVVPSDIVNHLADIN
jgi:hypothetical protein